MPSTLETIEGTGKESEWDSVWSKLRVNSTTMVLTERILSIFPPERLRNFLMLEDPPAHFRRWVAENEYYLKEHLVNHALTYTAEHQIPARMDNKLWKWAIKQVDWQTLREAVGEALRIIAVP